MHIFLLLFRVMEGESGSKRETEGWRDDDGKCRGGEGLVPVFI